ncbi:MAG: acyl dehydratase [Acidimicrobiia bacterium]|nr:acyl dehydratase [Acidimicrobiia bacterium]MYE71806.1 acyl dehydratase [Acidimicrobiia bacterium]MYJ62733.1 acyl dehydratase [Acidimicrobiia bacterium]
MVAPAGDGPWFEDFAVGQPLDPAPAITVGPGEAAVYQAICGDPLAISLSLPLAEAITGQPGSVVNPALVLQVAIGQSTVATRKVVANLFYRGVRQLRTVRIGDTLSTTVTVRGLREASARPDRPPRGLVLLGMQTHDNEGRLVLDFERCALVRRRSDAPTGHHDELGGTPDELDIAPFVETAPDDWNLTPLGAPQEWPIGETRSDPLRDTVTDAPALVRLTQNLAPPHRDASLGQGGKRLVYGGHTVGLAQAGLVRLLPTAATVVGWHLCDHTGPVFEDDVVDVSATLDAVHPVANGRLLAFTVIVQAERGGADPVQVLDWRPIVLAP